MVRGSETNMMAIFIQSLPIQSGTWSQTQYGLHSFHSFAPEQASKLHITCPSTFMEVYYMLDTYEDLVVLFKCDNNL